jgi:YVTN family beta-propeller protein
MLLVSKHLPGVTIYNADTLQQVCQGKTGISPHEAAFSRDGSLVYVPVYGDSGVGKPGTDEHRVHVFRTSDCSEVGSLDTGEYKRPHGIAVGRSGRVYLTAEIAESVLILDGKPNLKILAAVPTGSKTSHMLAVTRDEKRAYVSNVQSKTVSVLDLVNRKLAATVPTDGENQRMTLSPDEKWFVTSLGPEKKIAFYRTSDNQLDFTVPVDGTPFTAKFSRDGKYLYDVGFAGKKQSGAWKIDVTERKVVGSLASGIGQDPGSLEVDPFTGDVYISDQPTDKVFILDAAKWQIKNQISTAKTPDCMAFVVLRSTGTPGASGPTSSR